MAHTHSFMVSVLILFCPTRYKPILDVMLLEFRNFGNKTEVS